MSQLSDGEWDHLLDAIKARKCIFLLGPGATINFGEPDRLDNFLAKELKEKLPPAFQKTMLSYNDADRFWVLDKPSSRNKLFSPLKEFFLESRPNELLDLLVEVPFRLAITVTPDLDLNQAFQRRRLSFSHDHFDRAFPKGLPNLLRPEDQPMAYNLFGSALAEESLIVTHHDLFVTLKAMFSAQGLPSELLKVLKGDHAWHVVFLGFEFEKWYYQLVLYLLDLNNEESERLAPSRSVQEANPNQSLASTDFKVNFVESGLLEWVRELHHRADGKGLLRKGAEAGEAAIKVDQGKVFKMLQEGFTASDFETFCFLHFSAVHGEFTPGQVQTQRIVLLMKHCDAQGIWRKLLNLTKEETPFVYENLGPYEI